MSEEQNQEQQKEEEQKNPYQFEALTQPEAKETPLLESLVDTVYVLHHTSQEQRLTTILQALHKTPLHSQTWVLHNEGFHTGKKPPHVDSPSRDITHAYFTIFKHAQQHNIQGNILILEDDAFWSDKCKDTRIIHSIAEFLQQQKETAFVYSLGCLPFLALPTSSPEHWYGLFAATHACIYTPLCREKILNQQKELANWDWELIHPTCYFYHEPLAFQLFPPTENSQQWGDEFPYPLQCVVHAVRPYFVPWLGLDRSTMAYYWFYFFAKDTWLFLLLVVLFVLWCLVQRLYASLHEMLHGLFAVTILILQGSLHIASTRHADNTGQEFDEDAPWRI